MTYLERAKDIYNMASSGKMMEAFEKYYHQKVVMEEATGQKREGKDANREYEHQFMNSIKEFHGMGVKSIASNEEDEVTMIEEWMDVTFNDGRRMKLEEVSVQRWLEGQIIYEHFYYNPGQA